MSNSQMRLLRFRVTNFRSVEDSGWIETGRATSLIGVNESGKTNLLLPLWKLKPAKEGAINPIADYPRKRYNELRADHRKPVFIKAQFTVSDILAKQLANLTGAPVEQVCVAEVSRDFAGQYIVSFPELPSRRTVERSNITQTLESARSDLTDLSPSTKSDESLKEQLLAVLRDAQEYVSSQDSELDVAGLQEVSRILKGVDVESAARRSVIAPRFGAAQDAIDAFLKAVAAPDPEKMREARQLVMTNLPSFVYYSNYGNLDSEIYLPHVIDNMQRTDLGPRDEAKVRTLRVLFDFVHLKPDEILQLGRDFPLQPGQQLTDEQIKETAEKKKEREILLQSASAELTRKFRDWWKQGDYRFRLDADGDHFRIWVSDDKRPEEIELEGRSSGLQWFLSFYLIFLVESQEAHKGAILLLDEPGLTLHPLSQADLSSFFENLAETNQILYTTHSPFLVNANHLDRVKAVYVNGAGATVVSANLRAGESNSSESRSIYPVHAALGLTVSDILLQGCQPVIVEGPSDQLYLSAIKTFLIGQGRITPPRELLFMPGHSRKGIASLVAIVTGKDEESPFVLLDADTPGRKLAQELRAQTYQGAQGRVILVSDFLNAPDAEIEDMFSTAFMANIIGRYLRGSQNEDFEEIVVADKPIVPQVEAYASRHGIVLERGWKVEVAKRAKDRLLRQPTILASDQATLEIWTRLFKALNGAVVGTTVGAEGAHADQPTDENNEAR